MRVRLLRGLVNALFGLLTRRRVTGLEHIPASGPCVLVFNHLSNLDPPLIFGQIQRLDLTALVAAEYRAKGFHRAMIEGAGGRWIRRGASDRAALEGAIDFLARGWIVGIAPEGGRSPNHALRAAKPGAAFLALHAGVPVLPVGVTGTERVAASLKRFRRADITVAFGTLFSLPPADTGNHKQHLAACTDLMMGRVAELIPAAYRGVYGSGETTLPEALEPGEPLAVAAATVEGGRHVPTGNA